MEEVCCPAAAGNKCLSCSADACCIDPVPLWHDAAMFFHVFTVKYLILVVCLVRRRPGTAQRQPAFLGRYSRGCCSPQQRHGSDVLYILLSLACGFPPWPAETSGYFGTGAAVLGVHLWGTPTNYKVWCPPVAKPTFSNLNESTSALGARTTYYKLLSQKSMGGGEQPAPCRLLFDWTRSAEYRNRKNAIDSALELYNIHQSSMSQAEGKVQGKK